ncbi:hypothetical protein HanIR_Chr02g0057271 [Helianthus annuus]|nr:hypothetical protein HanIR_Chr02g0057271 [Helianthus annuus]
MLDGMDPSSTPAPPHHHRRPTPPPLRPPPSRPHRRSLAVCDGPKHVGPPW